VRKGPSTNGHEQYITLLDGKRRLANASAAFYNYSIGWVPMFQRKSYIGRNTLPINYSKITDEWKKDPFPILLHQVKPPIGRRSS
jgi:hypothetical protein